MISPSLLPLETAPVDVGLPNRAYSYLDQAVQELQLDSGILAVLSHPRTDFSRQVLED